MKWYILAYQSIVPACTWFQGSTFTVKAPLKGVTIILDDSLSSRIRYKSFKWIKNFITKIWSEWYHYSSFITRSSAPLLQLIVRHGAFAAPLKKPPHPAPISSRVKHSESYLHSSPDNALNVMAKMLMKRTDLMFPTFE